MRSLIMGKELAARYNYTEEGKEANGRTFEEQNESVEDSHEDSDKNLLINKEKEDAYQSQGTNPNNPIYIHPKGQTFGQEALAKFEGR